MGEVLKSWFRDRLGIMIDLNPDEFGATTKDGTLLAELLHSYGIIDNGQLETIINTDDPALARVNLRLLRLWLKFIGVDCDDDTIDDVSEGKGTTAIRLFYKIFVSLESKDKLHFITQQKEREKYIPNSFKFDVNIVQEKTAIKESTPNSFAKKLTNNWNVVAWHRNDKLKKILERCKFARKNNEDDETGIRIKENDSNRRLKIIRDNEIKELNNFVGENEIFFDKFDTYKDLCDERKKCNENLRDKFDDVNAAEDFVKSVKERKRRNLAIRDCKNRMEISLTNKFWEKEISDKEKEFDVEICGKLFNQSQYEKQMVEKLCEIRDQKRRFAKNRGIVDKLLREQTEAEHDMELSRERENLVKQNLDIEGECLRICELQRRIRERKNVEFAKKRFDICSLIIDDIVDIALAAASYRKTNEDFIPTRIWNEWKILFLKNERIYFDVEENDDEEEEEEEEIHLKMEKEHREEILSESDIDNYLRLESTWEEFVPEMDQKTLEILRLGEIVLGRVVHRILFEFSRSFSESEPQIHPVPKFNPACILLGVYLDKSAYSVLQTLLNQRRIKILRVEDGVNYCLQCYKEEATGERKGEAGIEGRGNLGVDEETQTPRSFPKDAKSPLSNSAQIGKTIDESFAIGKPIPETLNAQIIVEYAKSCFNEFKGWVLIDYPNTFNQMAMLEAALTGAKIPMEVEDSSSSGEKRIANYGAIDGESRLVFNPFGKGDPGRENLDLCITAFIKAFPKIPKDIFLIDEEITMSEILAPDSSTLDYFYADRGIAFAFYYSSLDLRSLKKLCGIIIGGDFSSPSIEAFGDLRDSDFPIDFKNDDREKLSQASVVKRLLVPALGNSEDDKGGKEMEECENGSMENFAENLIFDYNRDPKPGEDDWNWFDSPYEIESQGVLAALGNLWKNMEEIYLDKLKALFLTKRFINAQILPYRNRLAEHMKDLIETPSDIKQIIVSNFQKSFNDIGEDVRDDLDAKCELHCRVSDFSEQLYRLSDQRKVFADLERQRIIRDDWTAEKIVMIVNLYLAIIESEIHRCVDTVQIIQDYYTSMLKRNETTENRYEKYYLNRLKLRNPMIETSSIPQTKISKEAISSSASRKAAKNSTFKNNDREAPASVDFILVKKQIEESLLDAKDDDLLDPDSTICCQIIRDNILFAEKTIENLSISALEILRKEETSLFDKKAKNFEDYNDIFIRGYSEWKSALEFEKKRAIIRLKVLEESGKSEIEFVVKTFKKLLDKTRREIDDRYKREVKTVDDIAKLFSLAIEEALPVKEEVLLEDDRFLLKSRDSEDPLPGKKRIKEPIKSSKFQIGQLVRLMDIFRFLAPKGSIAERVFVYIIEDIVAFGDKNGAEGKSKNLLPDNFYKIPKEGDKIGQIIGEIFCNRDYIDWRDFLIYGMEIEMPSEDEILEMKSRFAALDKNLRQTVTREQFRESKIYFLNNDSAAFAKMRDDFIREDNFQRLEEEDFSYSREKCDNFSHGSLCGDIMNDSFDEEASSASDSIVDLIANRKTARLLMTKELICEIFASGCDSVCYTGFLLAFCKDEDPRIGFGKALALILGKKVCTSIIDGELYVEELTRNRESETVGEKSVARMIEKGDEREGIFSNTSSFYTDTTNDELSSSSNRDLIKFNEASIDAKNEAKNVEKNLENIFEIKFQEYDHLSKDNSSSVTTISAIDEITRNFEKQPTTTILSSSDSKIAHWIPIDVCLTALISGLPWHVTRQPDVSDTRSCLRECLKKVYADLFDVDLNGDEKSALSHRLINHCFIVNMIDSTTAFKTKNIADLLEKYLKRWDDDELFNS